MRDETIVMAWGALFTAVGGGLLYESLFDKFSWTEAGSGGIFEILGLLMLVFPNAKLPPGHRGF